MHLTSAVRWRIFACAAVAINALAFVIVRAVPRPAVGIGAALDVAVTVPALYLLLIVRGGLQPLISVLPLCLLGLLRATYLAPGIGWARPAAAAAAELAISALLVYRVRRGFRAPQTDPDILARIEAAAYEIVPARRLAAILAGEIAVFYFAFFSWRAPRPKHQFTIHEQSGVAALFGVLAGVSVMEAALVHVILARWSTAAAWALTALSSYGAIWLLAMARAFALRGLIVGPDEIVARSGMMWTIRLPRAAIAAVESGGTFDLKMPPASEPNLVLRLSGPLTARGIYGMSRQVSNIAIAVDDPEGFRRALVE